MSDAWAGKGGHAGDGSVGGVSLSYDGGPLTVTGGTISGNTGGDGGTGGDSGLGRVYGESGGRPSAV